MSGYKRIFLLILIMTGVSGVVGVSAVWLLYHAGFEEERHRLIEIAKSHARLIEAIARFDQTSSKDYPKGAREATLSQVQAAHAAYEGFGKTGEFTLAEHKADSIQFILSFRHAEPAAPKRIPLQSNLAEPMRRALEGRSGTLVGLDHRGVKVLAAYEPIAMLDLGIVAKLDLVEIRAPFLRAGSIVGVTTLLLIATGVFLFFRVSTPILQSIADSEERFRSIGMAAQDAIIMMDNDGKVSFWNSAAERTFGYQAHEASGQALTDLIIPKRYHKRHSDGAENFLRTDQGVLINRTVRLEAVRKDGTEFPVEISLSGVHLGGKWNVVGTIRDITDRNKAERKAQEKQGLLEQIIENIPHSIFWKDRHSVYLGCNRNFARQAGVENPEDIIGKTDYELAWKKTEANYFRKIDREVIESGQPQLGIEEPQLQADGTQATLLTSKVPLLDPQGDIIGILGIYADITERKRAEEKARRHQAELTHMARLGMMGEMGTGLAHELNQPLTSIYAYSKACLQMLHSAHDKSTEIKIALENIANTAEQAGELIKHLRHFVKKKRPQRTEIDINKLIQSTVDFIQYEAQSHHVEVSLELNRQLPKVLADGIQIEQVLLNIILNAIEAMGSGSNERRDLFIQSGLSRDKTMVQVEVSDTGPGMDEKLLSHVFDPFQTTKSNGIGVGLSISRSIIEAHEGRLWVESKLSYGTKFFINLPLAST